MKKSEKQEFDDWLQHRLTEVDLSPEELVQFTCWLNGRKEALDAEPSAESKEHNSVSTKDFFELLSWLKVRFKDGRDKF